MTLTTHAIVGAAIASFIPAHPLLAGVAGFASHFALDAIPHWDYPMASTSFRPNIPGGLVLDRGLIRDAALIALDALVGLLLAVVIFAAPATLWTIVIGATAAMLPDPLQFVHKLFPVEPLRTLQRFHVWIHTTRKLERQPILGIASQTVFVVAIIAVAHYAARW